MLNTLNSFLGFSHYFLISDFSIAGTIPYMSPEIFRNEVSLYAPTVTDIWALGCCVLEMANGNAPWSSMKFDNLLHAYHVIANGGTGRGLPPEVETIEDGAMREFILRCLVRDASKRPCAPELWRDPWLEEKNL